MGRLKRLVAAATVVAVGLLGGGAALAEGAGASLQNPGLGMGCTSGTDNCSGWVASQQQPACVAYNVNWVHYFTGASGGQADYHVTVDQWWNGGATCGGSAHLITNVADIYVQDWEVPHVHVDGSGQNFLEFVPSNEQGSYGSYDSHVWSVCHYVNTSIGQIGIYGADEAFIGSAGYAGGTYQTGRFAVNPAGQSTNAAPLGNLACDAGPAGGMSVDGTWIAWTHFLAGFGGFGNHYMTALYLR